MINIINDFVNGRKELWLEARLKKAKTEEEQMQLLNEASEKFDLKNWLPDAAKRAGQLSITTHPSKFTHTGARTTPMNPQLTCKNDGYLRSGNVEINEADATGNAAAMDVHTLLLSQIDENKSLIDAFDESHESLKNVLINIGLDFDSLRDGFLKMKYGDGVLKTDRLLKQVYFPVLNNQYHLLSLLTPSSMMWVFKKRIDYMRFSDDVKSARAAKKEQREAEGFRELYNLTMIGYGGTKPQVVSVLNNRYGGRSYLLPSIPPLFEKRAVRLPTRDFFVQTLYLKAESDHFITLHKWVLRDQNNIEIRQKIKKMIGEIIDQILYKAYQLRQNNAAGWSTTEYYQGLPLYQRIWLDSFYDQTRQEEQKWRDDVAKDMSRLIVAMYEDINQIKILGDPELKHIQKLIVESIEEDKEFF